MRKSHSAAESLGREPRLGVVRGSYSSLAGRRPVRAGTDVRQNQPARAADSSAEPWLLRRTAARNQSSLIILSVLLACGCSVDQEHYQRDQHPAEGSRNYFYGQLDGWQAVNYVSRPFNSLVQHSFCEEGGDFDPDVSADGRWMVFSSLRHSPNPDLYIKQISGSTATRLTSDPASEIQPSFSPTGDKVAYASNRSGSWDIWVIGVDGTLRGRRTASK